MLTYCSFSVPALAGAPLASIPLAGVSLAGVSLPGVSLPTLSLAGVCLATLSLGVVSLAGVSLLNRFFMLQPVSFFSGVWAGPLTTCGVLTAGAALARAAATSRWTLAGVSAQ